MLTARRRDALDGSPRPVKGVKVEIVTADLGKPDVARALRDEATASGPIDILINNAGFGYFRRFDEVDWAANCQRGLYGYCPDLYGRNFSGARPDGSSPCCDAHGKQLSAYFFAQSSFGEYALATERNVVKIDPEVPVELMGPLEPCWTVEDCIVQFPPERPRPCPSFPRQVIYDYHKLLVDPQPKTSQRFTPSFLYRAPHGGQGSRLVAILSLVRSLGVRITVWRVEDIRALLDLR